MGICATRSAACTASTDIPSRAAVASSVMKTRSVPMRPGISTLTVTPSSATSEASDFDQAISPARSVLEMPSTGIGCTAPVLTTVRIRPHCAARMAGSNRSVRRMTESDIDRKLSSQSANARPMTPP